jgi:hypothetical protein
MKKIVMEKPNNQYMHHEKKSQQKQCMYHEDKSQIINTCTMRINHKKSVNALREKVTKISVDAPREKINKNSTCTTTINQIISTSITR